MKNNRTFLDKLLDGAEVKWIPLGDVADYEQPTKYLVNSTVYNDNYPTPVLTAGKTFILGYTNEDEGIYFASKSPVIIFDDFTTANKWVDFDFKAKSSAMKMITSKNEKFALLKYIYYWLNTLPNNQTDGDHKRQWISNYANKLIPIPPLSVQTEIVKILDALTALTSELTSELTLRRKQYEYYREKLLSFDSLGRLNTEVAKKKLIDLAYFQNGKGHEKNIDEKGLFIVINSKFISTNGTVKKYCNEQIVPLFKDDILIVMSDLPNGKALAKTFFVKKDNKYTLNQRIGRITVKEDSELLPSFVNYFLNRNNQLTKYDNGTDQTNLRKDQILDVEIPIPPLEEQQRIVSILDKFETLTNSITEGLPLAIEQSQKRYEYYRELLLNFS
ncbi:MULTISPECIES: restriction endonuclease subunit S [Haemophilus]|uniref:Restriction endonuclease subunit S n=1 Tax=Haemophilus parainfluenzae TaxID=729 RepID=A0AB37IRU8_HAEPA|nr:MULTISPECIES: restriction endonuclease subunit S [Haemophilus]OFQ18649.1 restriction endonuclease subunit S [Haemophilus sp. HMSC073C03]RDE90875.1 restriction endonuclease subunit S [Haemophilus parainfluenzae]RDF05664.1 restriction endonuclease subunit S [Haemophilus parainfluenzae]